MDDETYSIRPARHSEVEILPEIERAAAALFAPYGLAALFSSILTPIEDFKVAAEQGRLWIAATRDDAPVGFALACTLGDNGHLDELDVLPAHGQRGIGTRLVRCVQRWAVEHLAEGVVRDASVDTELPAAFSGHLGGPLLHTA